MSAVHHAEFGQSFESDGFDTFWEQYGEVSGFESPGELALIWDAARKQYDPKLRVHNFDHAKDVVWTAMRLADEAEPAGTHFVNRKLLIVAGLFHDAGYQIDFKERGLSYAEELSFQLLQSDPTMARFSKDEIEEAGRLIMATHKDATPRTLEEKIMVRADIDSVGSDSFWRRNIDLAAEARDIKEAREQVYLWDIYALANLKTLAAYLDHDLTTGSESDQQWRQQAVMNFSQYLAKVAEKFDRPIKQFKAELGSQVMRIASQGDHFLAEAEKAAKAEADKPTDPAAS